jgi:Ni,Fe-hydrogenase maturation factor
MRTTDKRTILVFGNPLVKGDSAALKVAELLKGEKNLELVECDTAEDIERFGPDLLILDTAQGIDKVMLMTDLERIEQTRPYSMHDFDLGITLKLLMKMGKIKSVKIIAVPAKCDVKKAVSEVKRMLAAI